MRHDALQGDVEVAAMDQETLFINALLRTLVAPYSEMLSGFMLNICDHNDDLVLYESRKDWWKGGIMIVTVLIKLFSV